MNQTDPIFSVGLAARRRPSGLLASVMWLGGLIATLVAMTVGALLAVFTAVAVAVIAVVAGIAVFFTGLALRARRQSTQRRASDPAEDVIEARKVDGAWVTYGWDRSGR